MMVATRTGHPRHLALQRLYAKDSWSSLRPMIAGGQAVPLRLDANFLKNARIVYRGDQDRNSRQLGVESHEIVPREAELEHGGLADQVGMKSVPVIAVQPTRQLGDALARAVVGAGVGPLTQRALDEALGLAVGARVRPREAMDQAQLPAGLGELPAAAAGPVVVSTSRMITPRVA